MNGETDTGVLSSDKALPKPASLSPFRNNRKRPRQPRPVPELAEWFQTVASLGQSLLFDSDKKIGPRDLDQLADVVFQAYEEGAVLPQPTEKEVKLNQEQRRLIRRVAHAKKKANLIAALRIRQRLKQDGKLNSGRPAKGAPWRSPSLLQGGNRQSAQGQREVSCPLHQMDGEGRPGPSFETVREAFAGPS